jgi:Ca2+-binding RTX toxin-like protein
MAVIKGDASDNVLIGTRESDSLSGFGGDDRLYGLRGNDDLDGGEGADLMSGRVGDDIYWVDNPGDRVAERRGEGFFDQVRSTVSYALNRNVEHLVLLGTADIDGLGNAAENILIGNAGANRLNGRGGYDRMEGGKGNDIYVVDDDGGPFDEVVEYAGEGVDTVRLALPGIYHLPDNVENLIISDRSSAIRHNVDGNNLDNDIHLGDGADFGQGGEGADRISGLGGNDGLLGELGDDRLIGGDGDDELVGGEGQDYIFGGQGQDIIDLSDADMARDRLYYDVNPTPENADSIEGFIHKQDRFFLNRSVYAGLTSDGRLDPDAFHVGSNAADAEDRIIYNKAQGKVYYDPDGAGGAAMSLIATLVDRPVLSHVDFVAYGG